MNANLQMLLHAPPVQAVLCSMPIPPPPSDGPPTPRAEEPARSSGNPSLVPSSKAEDSADLGADGSTESADAEPHVQNETADAAKLQPSSNHNSIGAFDAGQNSPAEVPGPENAMCSCSPERAVLPSIEEHPEAAKPPAAAQPVQAQAPVAPDEAPLPAGMTVKTTVEGSPDAGDADADSSSQTSVSLMGVATPDIAHPPSAVEALQRGHQPWASSEAPAKLLQSGVSGSGAEDRAAPAARASPEDPTAAEGRAADTAATQGGAPGSAEVATGAELAKQAEADAAGRDPRPNTALPAPAVLPALKPGELFCAFRRFAHEVKAAISDVISDVWVHGARIYRH